MIHVGYRSIGEGRCAGCGYLRPLNASGRIRRHWEAGRGSPICKGSHQPPELDAGSTATVAPQPSIFKHAPNSVLLVLQLGGGRVFRCEVPLGVTDEERASIAAVIQTLHEATSKLAPPAGDQTKEGA